MIIKLFMSKNIGLLRAQLAHGSVRRAKIYGRMLFIFPKIVFREQNIKRKVTNRNEP